MVDNDVAQTRAKVSNIGGDDINTVSLGLEDDFIDPRIPSDRRKGIDSSAVPDEGCRRFLSRRTTVYMKSDEWWMKRNYNNGE